MELEVAEVDASLKINGVAKAFGHTVALKSVSLEVESGEILGIMGENGAGKSTLVKVIAGSTMPDKGTVTWQGTLVPLGSPRSSRAMGIAAVYQELSLCANLSIAENISLGRFPVRYGTVDWNKMVQDARQALDHVGLVASPWMTVGDLNPAQRQMVEIARALSEGAGLLLYDEPTSSLSIPEVEQLLQLMQGVKGQGAATQVFVNHKIGEVMAVCDRVAVLRDGSLVDVRPTHAWTTPEMIRAMVAREMQTITVSSQHKRQEPSGGLEVKSLNIGNAPLSFTVRKGEIVGFAGLVGSGRTRILRSLIGLGTRIGREILLDGKPYTPKSPQDASRQGVMMLPEDRRHQGLIPASVRDNVMLTQWDRFSQHGLLLGQRVVDELVQRAAIDARVKADLDTPVLSLSGGNQQKVLFARLLFAKPTILLLDEPTRGIDIGAKAEIYAIVRDYASTGHGVGIVSSELEELFELCDRIYVVSSHAIVGELTRTEFDREHVMYLMSGTKREEETV